MAKRNRNPENRRGAKTADQLRALGIRDGIPESLARWAEENTQDGIVTRRLLRRNLKDNAGVKEAKRNARANAGVKDAKRNVKANAGVTDARRNARANAGVPEARRNLRRNAGLE